MIGGGLRLVVTFVSVFWLAIAMAVIGAVASALPGRAAGAPVAEADADGDAGAEQQRSAAATA